MSKIIDMTDRQYGRLRVLTLHNQNKYKIYWLCRCTCGKICLVRGESLRSGNTRSCGCLRRERVTKRGLSKARHNKRAASYRNWTTEMEYVLRQLQTRCVLCKATENLTVDHVQPVSKGYNLYPGNAVVLCLSCNSRKGNKNLQELPLKTSYKLANAAYEFFVKWKIKESKERNVSYA